MMRSQLHHILSDAATRWPDATALTYRGESLSYSQLWDQPRIVGAGLRRLGLRRGERVAVYLDKRLETISATFVIAAASGVYVPINPVLRQKQVAYILDNCSCRMLITTPERLAVMSEELELCPSLERIVVLGTPAQQIQKHVKVSSWDELVADAPMELLADSGVIGCDMSAILYTSGSTGKPKGVVVSHRNLIVGAESVSSYIENSTSDVILSVLPLSFDAGFSQLTTGFHSGAHVVLVNYLLPEDVIRLCAQHKITGITAVPPLWIQLAEKPWTEAAGGKFGYFANTGGGLS